MSQLSLFDQGRDTPRLALRQWNRDHGLGGPDTTTCAAQYLRMSTDLQECSFPIQREAIERYAVAQGLRIVRTYADEGKSGLSLLGRNGLCQLLDDVTSGRADFRVVLVYDVSRWGRFQDCDEAGYYEHICRRAGVRVEYCTEAFRNDGAPMSTVMKILKRVMAGEYSRELSKRIFAAKCHLIGRGFRQGGMAGFGLRRLVVTKEGQPRGILEVGEHKYLQTDRVVQVPGPRAEIDVVRWIFEQVADRRRHTGDIARELNEQGVTFTRNRRWNYQRVLYIVTNEKYIGNLVYNRTSLKLQSPKTRNPPEQWVRRDGAFPPVIDPALFARAQAAIARWSTRITNEDALAALRGLLLRHGRLNESIIDRAPDTPGNAFYRHRFGSLVAAYRLIGYTSPRDASYLAGYAARRKRAEDLRRDAIRLLVERGVRVERERRAVLVIEGVGRVGVYVAWCQRTTRGPRWIIQTQCARPRTPWALIERLTEDGGVLDYCLTPSPVQWIKLGGAQRTPRPRHFDPAPGPLLDLLLKGAAGGGPARAPGQPGGRDETDTTGAGGGAQAG